MLILKPVNIFKFPLQCACEIFQPNCHDHEMSVLKMALAKKLLSGAYGGRGKYLHMRKVVVEVPMSRKTFLSAFSNCLSPLIVDTKLNNITGLLQLSDLESVLGSTLHKVYLKNSHTTRRIIGSISLSFREKVLTVNTAGRDR